jgi:hypothetical protein
MSFRSDSLPSLEMLGMNISSTLLLLGYHHTFDPFKYGLMLEIIFFKYVDTSQLFHA